MIVKSKTSKKIHKHLKLRHHKHTGKLLHHRHTSFRVLFALMLAPILMLSLVGHLEASAEELSVSARIEATIPVGKPVIQSPANGQRLTKPNVTVKGTCPVAIPAIIVAVYDGSTLKGSGTCTASGEFSVPITIGLGTHTLTGVVKTITDGTGETSDPVTFYRVKPEFPPPVPTSPPQEGVGGETINIERLPFVTTPQTFAVMDSTGKATYTASITGGTPPYKVEIDWGDGEIDRYTVEDDSKRTFTHEYTEIKTYEITITVTDSRGKKTIYQAVASSLLQPPAGIATADTQYSTAPPIVEFISQYIWQIYIGTLSSLVFLWYLQQTGFIAGMRR